MGLDASVYCDCFETGRLRTPHPTPELVRLAPDGSIEICSSDPMVVERHDSWLRVACPHDGMILEHQRLGNIALVGLMREMYQGAFGDPAKDIPFLWSKVVYSGSHGGDYIAYADVLRLAEELEVVRKIDFSPLIGVRRKFLCLIDGFHFTSLIGVKRKYLHLIDGFHTSLGLVVKAALAVKKPVAS